MSKPEIQFFQSPDAFYDYAAQRFIGAANQAIQQRGVFTWALSGGNTPWCFTASWPVVITQQVPAQSPSLLGG